MKIKEQKYSKKEEIIWKSLGVFRKQGYHKTSISDLSKACGIHNAHFYYYFKDKENLLEECLITIKSIFAEKVFYLAYQEGKPAKQRLKEMVQVTEALFLKYEGGCIMANTTLETAQYDAKFLPVIKSFFEEWMQAITHLYSEKYQTHIAQEKAEQTIQDIEGGILLMRLYNDEAYFLKALKRGVGVLDS